jgi:hypothetical protein
MIKENGPESADIKETEMLARDAVRIVKKLKGLCSDELPFSFGGLVNVLFFSNFDSNLNL